MFSFIFLFKRKGDQIVLKGNTTVVLPFNTINSNISFLMLMMIVITPHGNKCMSRISNGLSGFPEAWGSSCFWPTRKRYITPLWIARTQNLIDQNCNRAGTTKICGTIFSPVLQWKPQTLAEKIYHSKLISNDVASLCDFKKNQQRISSSQAANFQRH